jgi:hypothetical protein
VGVGGGALAAIAAHGGGFDAAGDILSVALSDDAPADADLLADEEATRHDETLLDDGDHEFVAVPPLRRRSLVDLAIDGHTSDVDLGAIEVDVVRLAHGVHADVHLDAAGSDGAPGNDDLFFGHGHPEAPASGLQRAPHH